MKTITLAAALSATLTIAASESCSFPGERSIEPSKNYITKRVNLSDIKSIKASTSVDVVYTQSPGKAYAEIYAPDNIVPYVQVQEGGGNLRVNYNFPKGESLSVKGKYICEVRVFAPEVTHFTTSSAADIKLANGLKTDKDVTFHTSSSGDIEASDIQCENLDMSTSSAGDITIENLQCRSLNASTSSSGDLKIENANCCDATVRAGSAGDCKINTLSCSGNIEAASSSSGDIHLSGSCKDALYRASSSGNIYAKDLKAKNVKANSSSGGDIECHATGELEATTSSGGDIRYKGNPTNITGKREGISRL